MSFRSKLLAILIALTLVFSVSGAFAVSATEEDIQYTYEDIETIAQLYGISFEDALTQLGITEDDLVESSSVSNTDAANYSYTDMISSLKFNTHTTAYHSVTYKLPQGGEIYSLDDDELKLFSYAGASKQDLLNNYNIVEVAEYTDPLNKAVVYYQITAAEDTPYGKFIKNYSDLSVEQQNSLVSLKVENGSDEKNTYTTSKNGNIYLVSRNDTDQISEAGFCSTEAEITTVINSTVYTAYIYVQHGGTATDAAVVDDLIRSFSVKGAASREVSTQTVAIVALCLAGLLFIITAFLVFFIIRFSVFSKASGSKFNIIGFNMPRKAVEPVAASKNTFRASTGIKESLEEESDSE